jgi:uncharacterized protein (TIGR03083 family)
MELPEHVEGLREAIAAFVQHAERAGLDARVPTAPSWTVHKLIAHQGMVHRWAAANLRGEETRPSQKEGLAVNNAVLWLHDGALDLVEAIEEAPDDVKAMVFLKGAPPPRQFWARRQCHETTIHAVDALGASLGRAPTAADTWINRDLALDGIDELVTGFIPRNSSKLRSQEPVAFAIRPTDSERSWHVQVSTKPAVTTRDSDAPADVVLEAPAVALYLALWNRSDEVVADGFDLWHRQARITWT